MNISAAARMSALQSDCNWQETFHSLSWKENETYTDILSYIKCFCYTLEGKHFVMSVIEYLDIVADYKMGQGLSLGQPSLLSIE